MLKGDALLSAICEASARRMAQQLSKRAHTVAIGCSRAALAGNGAPMPSFRAARVLSAPSAAAQLWSKGKMTHASAIRGCIVPGDSRKPYAGALLVSDECARLMHFGSRIGTVANTLRSSTVRSPGQRGICSVLEQGKQMGVASIGRPPIAALNAMRGAATSLSGQPWAYTQVRGMVKTKSKASRNAAAAMQRADGSGYEVGKEIVLFTCYAATRFRLLSLAAACYISFSVWVYYMHYYGDLGLVRLLSLLSSLPSPSPFLSLSSSPSFPLSLFTSPSPALPLSLSRSPSPTPSTYTSPSPTPVPPS